MQRPKGGRGRAGTCWAGPAHQTHRTPELLPTSRAVWPARGACQSRRVWWSALRATGHAGPALPCHSTVQSTRGDGGRAEARPAAQSRCSRSGFVSQPARKLPAGALASLRTRGAAHAAQGRPAPRPLRPRPVCLVCRRPRRCLSAAARSAQCASAVTKAALSSEDLKSPRVRTAPRPAREAAPPPRRPRAVSPPLIGAEAAALHPSSCPAAAEGVFPPPRRRSAVTD